MPPEVTPSAGEGSSAGGVAPSPSAPPPRPTDRDMLDKAMSPAAEPSPAGLEPAAAEPSTPGASPEATAEEQSREKLIPEELRELFKANPKLKEFRDGFFSDRAYRELFPQIKDARELHQLFPNLDDAKRAAEQAEQHAQLEELFTTDPDGYLKALSENNPEAFAAVSERFDGFLKNSNRQAWQARQEGAMRNLLTNAHAFAVESQNEDLQAAVDIIHQSLWGRPFSALPPTPSARERELSEREKALNEREEKEQAKTFQNYQQSVQTQYIDKTVEEIEKQITTLLPDVSEGARKRIVKEVFAEIDGRLQAMPAVMAELRRRGAMVRKSGKADEAAIEQAADFLTKRSLGLVAQVAAEQVSEWTKDILTANKAMIEKQQDAANRKDVGAGGGGAVPPKAPILPPGKKMTDREMLDAVLSSR